LSEEGVKGMPFLNNCKTYKDLHALNGKLVRYLCVVSDIQDPEMYITCVQTKTTPPMPYICKYLEDIPEDCRESDKIAPIGQIMHERVPVYTTGISHLNNWASERMSSRTAPKPSPKASKLVIEVEVEVEVQEEKKVAEEVVLKKVIKV